MFSKYEQTYSDLLRYVLETGHKRKGRNGYTFSTFGLNILYDMAEGAFPILCGRQMFPNGVFGELAAFLRGPKTIQNFKEQGCNYWDKWGTVDGSVTVDYGNAWLDFNGVNQLTAVITSLKQDPFSRRHIISGWRPDHLAKLSLPCCHLLYQWYVRQEADGLFLDMHWYQRSTDLVLGLPSDVILAFIWNYLMALETNYKPGKLFLTLGDTHIYEEHIIGVQEYLSRLDTIVQNCFAYPTYRFLPTRLSSFEKSHIILENYRPLPGIPFELIT